MKNFELKKEYLKFIQVLNSTNRIRNQKTEIRYSVKSHPGERDKLFVSSNAEKFLFIGYINSNFKVYVDPDLEFQNLISYFQVYIYNSIDENEINLRIKIAVSDLFSN